MSNPDLFRPVYVCVNAWNGTNPDNRRLGAPQPRVAVDEGINNIPRLSREKIFKSARTDGKYATVHRTHLRRGPALLTHPGTEPCTPPYRTPWIPTPSNGAPPSGSPKRNAVTSRNIRAVP